MSTGTSSCQSRSEQDTKPADEGEVPSHACLIHRLSPFEISTQSGRHQRANKRTENVCGLPPVDGRELMFSTEIRVVLCERRADEMKNGRHKYHITRTRAYRPPQKENTRDLKRPNNDASGIRRPRRKRQNPSGLMIPIVREKHSKHDNESGHHEREGETDCPHWEGKQIL